MINVYLAIAGLCQNNIFLMLGGREIMLLIKKKNKSGGPGAQPPADFNAFFTVLFRFALRFVLRVC